MWVHIVNCAGRLVFYFFEFSKHGAHLMLMKPICGRGFLTQWVQIDSCHYPISPRCCPTAQVQSAKERCAIMKGNSLSQDISSKFVLFLSTISSEIFKIICTSNTEWSLSHWQFTHSCIICQLRQLPV